MDKTIGIYKITNNLNGKFYIGKSNNIRKRWNSHKWCATTDHHDYVIYKAMRKYGNENFTFEVIEECLESDLTERETYYYETLNPEYNMMHPNNSLSPEHEAKRIAIFKTPEYRAKVSKRVKALWAKDREIFMVGFRKNGEKLKVLYNTPEYKKIFKEAKRKVMKPCAAYKDGILIKEFESYTAAGKWVILNPKYHSKEITAIIKVKAVCDGNRQTAYGYNWKLISKV